MIVVTGSNGFIGSNLIRNLNSLGISDILAVDNHNNEELKKNVKDCQIKEQLDIKDFLESIKKGEIKFEYLELNFFIKSKVVSLITDVVNSTIFLSLTSLSFSLICLSNFDQEIGLPSYIGPLALFES